MVGYSPTGLFPNFCTQRAGVIDGGRRVYGNRCQYDMRTPKPQINLFTTFSLLASFTCAPCDTFKSVDEKCLLRLPKLASRPRWGGRVPWPSALTVWQYV